MTITTAANNTTAVTNITSVSSGGNLLIRLRLVNGSAEVLTNVYLAVSTKIGSAPTTPVTVAQGGTASTTASAAFGVLKQAATTTASGVVELAIDSEAVTGSSTTLAVTPGNLTARLAAPGAIGGTTPARGDFTAINASSITNSGLTASLPVFTDANKALLSKSVANTKLALGIQAGTATTAADGAKTNTFPTAFGSAPYVTVSTVGAAAETLHLVITNVTATTFTTLGDAAGVYHWIAVGAP